MDIINTNRLRVSIRLFQRGFGERFLDLRWGGYKSGDHLKPRLESNYHAQALGVVAHMKWRPDGK